MRTLRVGFCATDREMIHGDLAEPPDGADFLVLGHELVGEVVEVGGDVSGLRPGDLVVTAIRRGCGQCAACAAGRADFCSADRFLEHGIRRLHGFARPYADLDAGAVATISPEVAEFGFLVEPLSVVEKAAEQVAALRARLPGTNDACGRAVVVGAGTIGLLAVQLLRREGWNVTAIDRRARSSLNGRLAVASGAEYVEMEANDIQDWAPAAAFDLALECSGNAVAAFTLMRHLGEAGSLVWIGLPLHAGIDSLPLAELVSAAVLRQQSVVGTVNASAEHVRKAARTLEALAADGVLQRMVTGVHPLNDFAVALEPGGDAIKTAIELAPIPTARRVGAVANG